MQTDSRADGFNSPVRQVVRTDRCSGLVAAHALGKALPVRRRDEGGRPGAESEEEGGAKAPDAAPTLQALSRERAYLLVAARRIMRDEASAEDLVHETLLRALSARRSPAASLRTFLSGVLRNVAADRFRDASRRRCRERRYAKSECAARPRAWSAESMERLERALLGLDPEVRSLVKMRYQDGDSLERIASLRGESCAAIKSRIYRGVVQLRRAAGLEF